MIDGRLLPLIALLLAGCASTGGEGGFPSLSKRANEASRAAGDETEGPDLSGRPAVPAEAKLVTMLKQLSDRATSGGVAFDMLYDRVAGQIRVSASAAVSSEAWVAAQEELGRLEQARYDSVRALADLDALYVERMKDIADGKAAGGVAEILAARAPVLAMVDSQNARIDGLRAVLKEP